MKLRVWKKHFHFRLNTAAGNCLKGRGAALMSVEAALQTSGF